MPDNLPFSRKKPGSALLYFRRRVPDDIKPLLTAVGSPHAGKEFIVVSLKTSDPKVAASRIAKLVRQTDNEWKALRNPSRSGSLRQAYQLLEQHGVDPLDPTADESALARFLETVADPATISGRQVDPRLSPVFQAAIEVARGTREFTLTDCLDQYIEARPATEKTARIAFGYLRKYLGADRDIRKVRRAEVNGFVGHLLAGGHNDEGATIRTGTVTRYVNTINAAFGRAIRENEFNIPNVFSHVEIPGKGDDAEERMPFTVDQLRALHAAIDQWVAVRGWDQLRCIITVLAETGARLAEIVGLAAADIRLDDSIPHIALKPHPWRSLKTPGSTRNIPLTDRAVVAFRAAQAMRGGSPFAFPRYAREEGCSALSVSASLVKWVRSRDGLAETKLGNHNLRHTMKDLLRAAQCPSEATDQLLGHRTPGVGAGYGRGYPLEMLAEWLVRATDAIRAIGTTGTQGLRPVQ